MTADAAVLVDKVMERTRPGPGGCWLWTGGLDRDGYGISASGRKIGRSTHRLMWILTNGPIAPGMVIDHLCFVRSCVNPAHMRVTTREFNARRQRKANPAACKHGHPFDEANAYYTSTGHRTCRQCNKAASARRRARILAERVE